MLVIMTILAGCNSNIFGDSSDIDPFIIIISEGTQVVSDIDVEQLFEAEVCNYSNAVIYLHVHL